MTMSSYGRDNMASPPTDPGPTGGPPPQCGEQGGWDSPTISGTILMAQRAWRCGMRGPRVPSPKGGAEAIEAGAAKTRAPRSFSEFGNCALVGRDCTPESSARPLAGTAPTRFSRSPKARCFPAIGVPAKPGAWPTRGAPIDLRRSAAHRVADLSTASAISATSVAARRSTL